MQQCSGPLPLKRLVIQRHVSDIESINAALSYHEGVQHYNGPVRWPFLLCKRCAHRRATSVKRVTRAPKFVQSNVRFKAKNGYCSPPESYTSCGYGCRASLRCWASSKSALRTNAAPTTGISTKTRPAHSEAHPTQVNTALHTTAYTTIYGTIDHAVHTMLNSTCFIN